MWDEEKAHLAKFNELIPKYRARPSALLPLWNIAGFALGKVNLFDGKLFTMEKNFHCRSWHSSARERSSYGMYGSC